jgi:hypothetical protein
MRLGDRLARLEEDSDRHRYGTPDAREQIAAALRRLAAGRRLSAADKELLAGWGAWFHRHPDTPNLVAELTDDELWAWIDRGAKKLARDDELRPRIAELRALRSARQTDTIHPSCGPERRPDK